MAGWQDAPLVSGGADQRSKGVMSNGMLPGHEGNMDRSKAGDNWATFEMSEEGIPKHYVLPTKPGDRMADDATGFMGDAVERFQKTKQHYGAFDTDEAGEAFMKAPSWADAPMVEKPTERKGGLLRNFAAGAVEGVTGAAGFLADAGRALAEQDSGYSMFRDTDAVRPPLGQPQHFLNEQIGKVGFNPEDVPADTTAERLVRGAGVGASSGVIPGGGLSLAARTALGAITGLGGEAAAEVAPDAWKPAARVVGGFATGFAGIAAATTVEQAITAAGKAADRSMGPFTNAAREQVVGEMLAKSATDLPAVKASLAGGPDEIVPGSTPTTFQQTGDMGLGGLEREVQTKNPAEFQQRRADQNTARREQLGNLQPTGNAADLADYVKGRVRWLDQQTEQDVAEATRVAQQRAEGLGGTRTPEEYGTALRDPLQEARDAAKVRERALWRAVDPNGDLTVNAGPVRLEANSILSGIQRSAKPPIGDEMHILQAASEYGTAIPFSELGALRTSVNDAMRAELRTAGQTQVYGRLSRMRSAIERSINSAIERRATEAPEELQAGLTSLEQQAARWAGNGAARGEGVGAYDATGTGGVSPVSRERGPVAGGSGTPPGDQGLPGQPTFDEAAAGRLREATQATRERADTFDRGPVGQVLAKAGRQDQYKLTDAGVGLKVFPPGPRGAETVAAYRQAVGDEAALANLQDYAASSLRRVASNPDLTLDPGKVSQWLNRHADAMRAFPELHERFRDATAASAALAEAAASRRAILDSAQSGALGKIANLDDPEAVTRTVGAIFGAKDGAAQMRELARTAARNPDAREGLRKAVADHISQKLVSNTEVGTSGEAAIKSDQFQTFVRQNRAALSEVFTPEEVGSLEAIAADLQRSNRSLNAVKIPGQSNTAQDLLSAKTGKPSILRAAVSDIVTAGTAAAATLTHGFGAGLVALLGTKTIAALRNAGITKTDELLREAMLNPQVAKALLSKVPDKPGPTFQNILADRMRSALRISVSETSGRGAGGVDARLAASGLGETDKIKTEWAKGAHGSPAAILAAAPKNQELLANAAAQIGKEHGSPFVNPGAKTKESLERKLSTGRSPQTVTDAVRGGFNVTSPEQADAIINGLAKKFEVADEGWQMQKASGYFDRKVMVRFPDGMVGEVQMWPPGMYKTKELRGGHALYEKSRAAAPGSPEAKSFESQMRGLYAGVRSNLSSAWHTPRR